MDYVSGTPTSDHGENDWACFVDMSQAAVDPNVTDSTRFLLTKYLQNPDAGFSLSDFVPEGFDGDQYTMFTP